MVRLRRLSGANRDTVAGNNNLRTRRQPTLDCVSRLWRDSLNSIYVLLFLLIHTIIQKEGDWPTRARLPVSGVCSVRILTSRPPPSSAHPDRVKARQCLNCFAEMCEHGQNELLNSVAVRHSTSQSVSQWARRLLRHPGRKTTTVKSSTDMNERRRRSSQPEWVEVQNFNDYFSQTDFLAGISPSTLVPSINLASLASLSFRFASPSSFSDGDQTFLGVQIIIK